MAGRHQEPGRRRRPLSSGAGTEFSGALAPALASFAVALAIDRLARLRPRAGTRAGAARRTAGSPGDGGSERKRGRGADTPTQIPPAGWRDIAWRIYAQIGEDRILAVAAGVTFYGLLAIFPAIAALVTLYGLVADAGTINDQLAGLSGVLPSGALDIVSQQVHRITSNGGSTLGFALVFSLGASLWSANAGMKAVFDALNVAYDEKEKRNFFVLNLWSLGFTLGAILFLILALSSIVVIPIVLTFIGLGGVTAWLIWLGRWPLMIVVVLAALAILYRYGPSRDHPKWRWIAPGSLLAAIGWLIFSLLFSWYVASFGSYNKTYGSLGAAIGFMTWMWLSATILLVGAELNSETEHQTAEDTTRGPPEPLGRRGAHAADTVGRAAGRS